MHSGSRHFRDRLPEFFFNFRYLEETSRNPTTVNPTSSGGGKRWWRRVHRNPRSTFDRRWILAAVDEFLCCRAESAEVIRPLSMRARRTGHLRRHPGRKFERFPRKIRHARREPAADRLLDEVAAGIFRADSVTAYTVVLPHGRHAVRARALRQPIGEVFAAKHFVRTERLRWENLVAVAVAHLSDVGRVDPWIRVVTGKAVDARSALRREPELLR